MQILRNSRRPGVRSIAALFHANDQPTAADVAGGSKPGDGKHAVPLVGPDE
jgi:hypothetical protein